MNKKKTITKFIIATLVCFIAMVPVQAFAKTYSGVVEIDLNMTTPDGQPFNGGSMQADIIKTTATTVWINPVVTDTTWVRTPLASNIPITSDGSGTYKHTYGPATIEAIADMSPEGIWYENLRIATPKYVKNVSLGPVKTYRMIIKDYQPNWTPKPLGRDLEIPFTNPNSKITKISPGQYEYKGDNTFSGYFGTFPQIEFTGIRIGVSLQNGNVEATSSAVDKSGNKVSLVADCYMAIENFEDTSGAPITPPSGYTQGKYAYANAEQFTHTMNGTLPSDYTIAGKTYVFEGWYRGATKPGTLNQSKTPSVSMDYTENKTEAQFDDLGKINVVYRLAEEVSEKYVDESGSSVNSGAWDSTTPTPILVKNATFPIPYTVGQTKTDSGGADWEYKGWKYSTDPVNTVKTTSQTDPITVDTEIQYIFKKKQQLVVEKWVNELDGTTLIPMTGNPNTNTVNDNDNFTGSASATVTDSSSAIWDYVGWENVTDAPGTVNASPNYAINNIKGNKEIRYHYKARNTTVTMDLTPTPQVLPSGSTVSWSSRLTNTGPSPLNNLNLKATSNWAAGLTAPTQVTVTPASGPAQNYTITPADWASGFNLTGITVPSGGPNNYATITFSTVATGAVNQVLPAEIELDGNINTPMKADNFVRIDDPDEPNLNPVGNAGLINIPDFRFGLTEVKPFAQIKGLEASSYQSGYNPYIRLFDKESTGGWSLTAKLGQFTSGAQTLPTTTAIRLKNGDMKEVVNYNKHNESLTSVGSVGTKVIPSDSTTVALTNGSIQGVYQLDYAFNDVELDLLAHSGVAGLSYNATMDWTLTTAP